MIINPNVEEVICNHIQNVLCDSKLSSIKDIRQQYISSISITKAELINTVKNGIDSGTLAMVIKKNPWEDSIVRLVKPFQLPDFKTKTSIVISRPRLRQLSLESIERRNNQIDSVDCFRKIISSAKIYLRICSPFIEENVLDASSFPDLYKLLSDALKRDVKIRLLTRELFKRPKIRGNEVQWLIDMATDLGKRDNLKIMDYHFSEKRVISSTHAKLIIADFDMAYVGSAELRMNNLVANFEVGCLIEGTQVFGICEIFDLMFSQGSVWK